MNRIGPWRLVRLLGQGAVTRVFQAAPADREGVRHADYVIKTSAPGAPAELVLQLLRQEAAASHAVACPHLPALLEAAMNDNPPYLVFPFLDGGTLAERLARFGPAPPVLGFWMMRQTVSAVRSLHAAGWTHGDVKPANMLISRQMHTTLIDLGFAQRLDTAPPKDSLRMATPGYAAPELHHQAPSSAASDVYGLGVTLFEVLSGRRPFQATTPQALAEAHCYQPIPKLSAQRSQVPPEVDRLLQRMLAKDPVDRPEVEDVEAALLKLEIECFDQRGAA